MGNQELCCPFTNKLALSVRHDLPSYIHIYLVKVGCEQKVPAKGDHVMAETMKTNPQNTKRS